MSCSVLHLRVPCCFVFVEMHGMTSPISGELKCMIPCYQRCRPNCIAWLWRHYVYCSGDSGSIRLLVRLTEESILPSKYYKPLVKLLTDCVTPGKACLYLSLSLSHYLTILITNIVTVVHCLGCVECIPTYIHVTSNDYYGFNPNSVLFRDKGGEMLKNNQ